MLHTFQNTKNGTKLVKSTGLDKATIKDIIGIIFQGQHNSRENIKQATTAIAPLVL